MTIADRMADTRAKFLKFRIDVPWFEKPHIDFEFMIKSGQRTRGSQQLIKCVIGPTQTGKSSAIIHFIDKARRQPGPPPNILHVTLMPSATTRSLGIDIMRAAGKESPPMAVIEAQAKRKGRPRRRVGDDAIGPVLLHNALDLMTLAGVDLLVLDELHHLVSSDSGEKTRWSVMEAIKVISIAGVCPVVCVGIPKLWPVVRAGNNSQFAPRNRPPYVVRPLDPSSKDDRKQFRKYIAALDNLLVEQGVFPRKSDLARSDWTAQFFDVCRGFPGRVSNLVEQASYVAMQAGRDVITEKDLSEATRDWAIMLEIADYDPWGNGPRDLRTARDRSLEELI